MNYLSLFSGIEAATVAWRPLGWKAVGFAEIEPFPSALLAHHYPDVPNLGDVTQITDEQIAALGHIDVVVGGSPCQDMSVAGKRQGLAGERSSLFHHLTRIFHAARTFCGARFLLWENVPGAFSSNGGRDFACVVTEMAGCEIDVPDGWGKEGVALGESGLVEWAVLDSQWFGLAQRRERVFALLDTGDWQGRPPVLLEPDSLRGDHPPRREAREEVAGTFTSRARSCGWGHDVDMAVSGYLHPEVVGAVSSKWAKGAGGPAGDECQNLIVAHGTQDPIILMDCAHAVGRNHGQENVICVTGDVTHSVGARADSSEDGTGRGTPIIFCSDVEPTVNSSGPPFSRTGNERTEAEALVASPGAVRRLTVREVERLFGFPDDYTQVPYRGKPSADSTRYKALGNSMAVPVMNYIGKRIENAARVLVEANYAERDLRRAA